MEENWHFYISVTSEEQVDVLIEELSFIKEKIREIKPDRSDYISVELKSKDWSSDAEADIMETIIKY